MSPSREERPLGLSSAAALVVANMVGAGIFATTGFLAADLGDGRLVLLAWALGGLLALAGALSYAELGAMMPGPGAETLYVRRIFGPRLGFLCGFVTVFAGFAAPIAAVALAFGEYLERGLAFLPARWTAPAAIVLLTLVHGFGVSLGARVNDIVCLLKVLLLLLFVAAGLLAAPTAAPAASRASAGVLFSSKFAVSLVFVSFAYSGWNAAAYVGGEIRSPERLLPRSLLLGTGFVTVLYLLVNLVFLRSASPAEMAGVQAVGDLAAGRLFGERVGALFSVGIAVLLFSSVSAMTMAGPRVILSLAREGDLPAPLAKVGARGAPTPAVLLQGAASLALLWTAAFEDLLSYVGLSLSLFAGLAVLGLIRLRRRSPELRRPFRVPGYPWVPLAFVLLSAWMIAWSVGERPEAAAASAATMLVGLALRPLLSGRPRPPGVSSRRVSASSATPPSRPPAC